MNRRASSSWKLKSQPLVTTPHHRPNNEMSATTAQTTVRDNRTPSEEFLDICERYNFVGYSFERIGMKMVEGQPKKDPIGQPIWTKVNKTNFKRFVRPSHKAFAIITGDPNKYSGLTVIDCDKPEAYDRLVTDFPELKDTLTAQTKKGKHVYCQFVPTAKNNTHSFHSYPDVDIRTEGGVVFAQPTVYDWPDGPYAYKYVNLGAAILPMPQKLIDDLKDHSRTKNNTKTRTQPTVSHLNKPAPTKPDSNPELANEIRELENEMPIDSRDTRIPWIQLGAIIHHELGDTFEAKELFLELSRRSPRHKGSTMADMDSVWKDFGQQKENPATIASLHYAVLVQRRNNMSRLGFGFLRDIDDDDVLGADVVHADAIAAAPGESVAEEKVPAAKKAPIKQPSEPEAKTKAELHPIHKFDFNKNINQTTLARYFVQRYGNDFVKTFKLDGTGLSLFHWNAATTLWEPTIKAKLYVMLLLGEEFFDDLQKQAKCLKGGSRTGVYKVLAKLLQSHSGKESIYQEILTYLPLVEDVVFDTSRSQCDNLHFRNGVLLLNKVTVDDDTGVVSCEVAFRPRVKEDYITETLEWDFGPASKAASSRVKEMFRQIQPERAQSQFQLDWLAYSLTGH